MHSSLHASFTSYPPSMSDTRPHTSHVDGHRAITFIAEEDEFSDGEITPRAHAPAMQLPSTQQDFVRRRLSRDDTANDMHLLTTASSTPLSSMSSASSSKPTDLFASCESTSAMTQRDRLDLFHTQRPLRERQSIARLQWSASTVDLSTITADTKTASLGRRFSRHYREKLRENIQRVVPGKSRRSSASSCSTDVSVEEGEHSIASSRASQKQLPQQPQQQQQQQPMASPSSPGKRSARQIDGRPRKHNRHAFFGISDRKDTPAPAPAVGMPLRPATSHRDHTIRRPSVVIAAPGGDRARQAAALHNNFVSDASPEYSSAPFDAFLPTTDHSYLDIHSRRQRVGSCSSAADSGADLSTFSGASDTSSRDQDGDITMTSAASSPIVPQPSFDFTKMLPNELALTIFHLLEAQDLVRAELVNKAWYALAQDTSVWRTAFLRKYERRIMSDPPPIQVGGLGIGRPNRPDQEWRKMYKARVDLEKNWRAGAHEAGKAIYLSGHTDSVYCLQFDEEKIITGSRDRTIRVWDINTFQCLRVIGGPNVRPALGPKVLRTVDYPSFHMATASVNGTAYGDSIYHVPDQWHDASILCLQYDDEILVTGSSDSDLLIWDIKTYQPIKRLRKHTGGVLDVALDSRHIVSCSKDSRIIVWDRKTLEAKGDLTGHRGPVNAVQLRGHLLVSASGDGIARLWDLNQMKLIKEFSAKERGLAAVEFSEDMQYVLAGGNDNITYKFERETGREVMQFCGHSQLVRSLWLDSANSRVVSGSYDLDLRVYDFTTGEELWRGEEWTTSWMLAAKSDYRRIVATSQDGRILIVDFGIQKGVPCYKSKDGMPVENIDLLRGTDKTTAITFRNPFEPPASRSILRSHV